MSFIPASSVASYNLVANSRPDASACTFANMSDAMLPIAITHEPLIRCLCAAACRGSAPARASSMLGRGTDS